MMGCNFYRPLPAGENKYFAAAASKPIDAIFAQAKRLPFVLVTGEHDPNQPQTKANYQAFGKDRFTRLSYIEVPGVGHNMPDATWFEKGLRDLDNFAASAPPTTHPATRPTARPILRRVTPRTAGS